MFGRRITLFRLLGFEVRLDWSWLIIALSKMNRSHATRLLVVDHDRLVGILALRDLLRFLSLKLEIEPA